MFQLNIVVIQEKGNKKYTGKTKMSILRIQSVTCCVDCFFVVSLKNWLKVFLQEKIPKNVFKQHEEVHKWSLNRILRENIFTPFILLFLPDKRRTARKARSCK